MTFLNQIVDVCANYDTSNMFEGLVVSDEKNGPTIILLEDGLVFNVGLIIDGVKYQFSPRFNQGPLSEKWRKLRDVYHIAEFDGGKNVN